MTCPTANQVARAIVTAAYECDEDAIEIANGAVSKARVYAFVAIRELFPRVAAMSAARWFGAPKPSTLVGQGSSSSSTKWWNWQTVRRVKWAVENEGSTPDYLLPSAPVAAEPDPAPDSTDDHVVVRRPKRPAAPAMSLNPIVRRQPPARSGVSLTAALMGDPPPERSALDQGYRPGSGIARERA